MSASRETAPWRENVAGKGSCAQSVPEFRHAGDTNDTSIREIKQIDQIGRSQTVHKRQRQKGRFRDRPIASIDPKSPADVEDIGDLDLLGSKQEIVYRDKYFSLKERSYDQHMIIGNSRN